MTGILINIQLVFYQADDGKKDICASQPVKDIVDTFQLFAVKPDGYLPGDGSQDDDRLVRILGFDLQRQIERIHIADAQHIYDQIDLSRGQHLQCLTG